MTRLNSNLNCKKHSYRKFNKDKRSTGSRSLAGAKIIAGSTPRIRYTKEGVNGGIEWSALPTNSARSHSTWRDIIKGILASYRGPLGPSGHCGHCPNFLLGISKWNSNNLRGKNVACIHGGREKNSFKCKNFQCYAISKNMSNFEINKSMKENLSRKSRLGED